MIYLYPLCAPGRGPNKGKTDGASIDAEDYNLVHQNGPWTVCVYGDGRAAVHWQGRKMVLMHRLIVGAGPHTYVYHQDGDGLNNRRGNIVTSKIEHGKTDLLAFIVGYVAREGYPPSCREMGVFLGGDGKAKSVSVVSGYLRQLESDKRIVRGRGARMLRVLLKVNGGEA